jgi:hypothetical protein
MQHVVGDAIQARRRRALMRISEPLQALPRQSKDLGSQISGILPNPGARPREDLADVSVVKLGKAVRIVRAQEIGLRQTRPHAHDLYRQLDGKCVASPQRVVRILSYLAGRSAARLDRRATRDSAIGSLNRYNRTFRVPDLLAWVGRRTDGVARLASRSGFVPVSVMMGSAADRSRCLRGPCWGARLRRVE